MKRSEQRIMNRVDKAIEEIKKKTDDVTNLDLYKITSGIAMGIAIATDDKECNLSCAIEIMEKAIEFKNNACNNE